MLRFSVAVLLALASLGATPAGSPAAAPPAVPLTQVARSDAQVVGDGTPQSCTSAAVVGAVRRGGLIRFACGPEPVTI